MLLRPFLCHRRALTELRRRRFAHDIYHRAPRENGGRGRESTRRIRECEWVADQERKMAKGYENSRRVAHAKRAKNNRDSGRMKRQWKENENCETRNVKGKSVKRPRYCIFPRDLRRVTTMNSLSDDLTDGLTSALTRLGHRSEKERDSIIGRSAKSLGQKTTDQNILPRKTRLFFLFVFPRGYKEWT